MLVAAVFLAIGFAGFVALHANQPTVVESQKVEMAAASAAAGQVEAVETSAQDTSDQPAIPKTSASSGVRPAQKGALLVSQSSITFRVGQPSPKFTVSTGDGSAQLNRLTVSRGPSFLSVATNGSPAPNQKSTSWEVFMPAVATATPGTYNIVIALGTSTITYEVGMTVVLLPEPTFAIVGVEAEANPELPDYSYITVHLTTEGDIYQYLFLQKVEGLPEKVFCTFNLATSVKIVFTCNNYYGVEGSYPVTVYITENLTGNSTTHSVSLPLVLYK